MATTSVANSKAYSAGGGQSISAGDYDTITLSGGGDSVTGHDHDIISITGGGNTVSLHSYDSLTVNDARSVADGLAGSVNFGDTVSLYYNDTISLNYSLAIGNSDSVTIGVQSHITYNQELITGLLKLVLGSGDSVKQSLSVTAGGGDSITFAASGMAISLSLGKGDTISTSGSNDTITIGGGATSKSVVTIGATASGTTVNGGLGTDTFSAGSGYTGGNQFAGSAHGLQDGFAAIGNCANYSGLTARVSVDFNANVGQGFDAVGNRLWTDTYSNMQQVKAGKLDGNQLTGSNSYYCELKGGLGSTTYYDGAGGDRIIWSSAGATALLDGKSTDVAYAGKGNDEFYWRNSPGGKGVSNFGETIDGFTMSQGDDLNLSEFADTGFAGVTNPFNGTSSSLFTFVDVSLANGDTSVWFDKTGSGNFTQLAAVLKSDNLFRDFGVTDYSNAGAQQVVQDMYNTGHLVLNQPH